MTSPYPPIADYAMIGDCHGAALVSRDGSVDWCCFHRFDARPAFMRLLDWSRGGYFRVAPQAPYTVTRRYWPGTMVLETRFRVDTGSVVLVDCFPMRPESDPAVAEAVHPFHQLIRWLRCEAGEVSLRLEFSPRFDFGRTVPRLETRGEGLAVVYGGADALVLESELPLTQTDMADCTGETVLRDGDEAFLAVTYARPHELRAVCMQASELRGRVNDTRRFWTEWTAGCTYEGPFRDQVLRSAIVLKALSNAPTGAIVAAPTTSLPEQIGGSRNWDYRFAWLRDAAMDLYALYQVGRASEAAAFMAWLRRTTAGRVEDLQIVYGVGGERLLPEIELTGMEGYRGSRPVRIGNRAAEQFQLDVYGFLLDTAWLHHKHGGTIDPIFWEFLSAGIDAVAARWTLPDSGIWEVRGEPQHFTSSKLLAWVAVDRAIRLARARGYRGDLNAWVALRRQIRRRIEAEGIDPATGAFVRAFGSPQVDASLLLIPLVRFLPPDDPRVRNTLRRVEADLTHDGLVYRYRTDDGLPGDEGAFLICSFWLVDNLALTGDIGRAQDELTRLLGYGNDLGLFAEQIDPRTGESLGNFPQAFSHVGLIGAVRNLQRAQELKARRA
ncbi:MAG TPA: glycoside hydrolase family 15 protein [bacterium]|jgi:GH15 family glucan-1,4-alpha-glucosidase|nr:glycoside hydrolase family 15 protein [bacterium]